MIRRVLSQPGPAALSVAGLPPGTPVTGPVRMVYYDPAGLTLSQAPGSPVIASDGAPLLMSGPATWGQVRAAGRLQ